MHEIKQLLLTFGLSLSLTLVLELPIALLFRMRGRDLLLFLLVNLLTNPAAVYLSLLLNSLCPGVPLLLLQLPIEAAVVGAEGLLYAKLARSLRLPWLFALTANVFSYGIGLLINIIF